MAGTGGRAGAGDRRRNPPSPERIAAGVGTGFCDPLPRGKIPARLVTGFQIKPDGKAANEVRPRTWVEVYAVNHWEPYDPENGFLRELDYNIVPVRRDGIEPVRVIPYATDLTASYSVESLPPATPTVLGILDLHRLPQKLHEPVKVVLILPIGALFTAFMRTIIGMRTFGTFSPTLLALAFVYNDWQSGLCIFFVVIGTGFVSRTLLDRLRLLLVPRLGIILTMVVMLMVLSIAVMNFFQRVPNGQTVLLPMVILTNLVERFYVTSEEDLIFQAVRLLTASGFLALVIYLLLSLQGLGNLLFDNPELHFFTVAALVLMGRYTGYRLTELRAFPRPGPSPGAAQGLAACRKFPHGASGPGRASCGKRASSASIAATAGSSCPRTPGHSIPASTRSTSPRRSAAARGFPCPRPTR